MRIPGSTPGFAMYVDVHTHLVERSCTMRVKERQRERDRERETERETERQRERQRERERVRERTRESHVHLCFNEWTAVVTLNE